MIDKEAVRKEIAYQRTYDSRTDETAATMLSDLLAEIELLENNPLHASYHAGLKARIKLLEAEIERLEKPKQEVVAWKADNGQWATNEKDAKEYERRMGKKMYPLCVATNPATPEVKS